MPHVIEQSTVSLGVVILLILHCNSLEKVLDLTVGGNKKSHVVKLLKIMWSAITKIRQNKTRAEVMQA